MKKSRFKIFRNKWFIIAAVLVLAVAGIAFARSAKKAPNFQYTAAAIGDVVERVSVTGTVSASDKADLAFQKSGAIAHIYVKVGDPVHAGQTLASLDSANDAAALASARATLADMSRSLTPSELAVQTTSLLNADLDAYAKAQGALVNYADTFFTNPQSANPTLNFRTDSPSIAYRLGQERAHVTDVMRQWSAELSSGADADGIASDAAGYLTAIKDFMDDLAATVNALNSGNSGLSAAQISAYAAAMNSGVSQLNAAVDSVTTAQSSYNLKLSGNSSESIASQAAKVAQAEAQLSQDSITSPLDGVVTKADPSEGEFVSAGSSGFAVQGSGWKIEAYVPEADIAKVAVGDLASTTLDAYGSNTDFPARVVSIDPAETVLEGVPTYKVTLQFVNPDQRVRSGMTANLEILTHEAVGVLEVPYRAVSITSTSTTIRLVSKNGKSYSSVPVTTGLKGSDGTIQIISGLQEGDKVVTYVKQ